LLEEEAVQRATTHSFKDGYGNLAEIVKNARKVYPWLTYAQVKGKVTRMKKAVLNPNDITAVSLIIQVFVVHNHAGAENF
jgi:hypothetical protein